MKVQCSINETYYQRRTIISVINEAMQQHLFNLVSSALHNYPYSTITLEEWTEIYKELQAQSIQVLPANIIDSLHLSEEAKKSFSRAVALNLQQFYTVLEEQTTMLAYLSRHFIPVVILKGTASAVNYLYPEYRCMGDIDILVPPEQFEDAYNVLRKYYEAGDTIQDFHRHIHFLSESGVTIELHQFFSNSGNKEQDMFFNEKLYKAIPHSQQAVINGYEFPMLPPLENGLVLLGHINQHLDSGLGLRQIVDWMCFVERYLNDETWEEFASLAEQIGIKKLAVVVTAMCQKYLGLSSEINWCQIDGETDLLCRELMDYILAHGNFGRKIGFINITTVSIIRWFRNPVRGICKAQEYGLHTWGAYKRHHWLRPFAWIYQVFRWITHGVNMGVGKNMLRKSSTVEKKETDLLGRLRATRKCGDSDE